MKVPIVLKKTETSWCSKFLLSVLIVFVPSVQVSVENLPNIKTFLIKKLHFSQSFGIIVVQTLPEISILFHLDIETHNSRLLQNWVSSLKYHVLNWQF